MPLLHWLRMENEHDAAAEAWGVHEQDHACSLAVEGLHDNADEATNLSAIHQVRPELSAAQRVRSPQSGAT